MTQGKKKGLDLAKIKNWKKDNALGQTNFSVRFKPGNMFAWFQISRRQNESLLTVKMETGCLFNQRFPRYSDEDNKLPFTLADKLFSQMTHPKVAGLHTVWEEEELPAIKCLERVNQCKDIPSRCESFNNFTDALCKAGLISEKQYMSIDHPKECK